MHIALPYMQVHNRRRSHSIQDAQLQKKLQQVLKLNKEKWEEARDHALKAVVVDNRMRVWWAAHPGGSSSRIGASPAEFAMSTVPVSQVKPYASHLWQLLW